MGANLSAPSADRVNKNVPIFPPTTDDGRSRLGRHRLFNRQIPHQDAPRLSPWLRRLELRLKRLKIIQLLTNDL
jgi:hypothetical protein